MVISRRTLNAKNTDLISPDNYAARPGRNHRHGATNVMCASSVAWARARDGALKIFERMAVHRWV